MLGSGKECMIMSGPYAGVKGWHLHSYNDTIGTALEFQYPTWATAFAQLAAEDQIEWVSASAADTTQYVTVYGIDNAGNKIKETKILTGQTVVLSTNTWRYVENVWVDKECAGIITVQRETNTYIMEIEVGGLNSGACHHFNGECESYITFFAGGLYDDAYDATYQLRWYPDDADCLDATDGFEVLDELFCTDASGHDVHSYGMPIGPLPKGGYIAVWALSDAASAKGFCTLQGFDVEVPA